jgi:hypothetical protein
MQLSRAHVQLGQILDNKIQRDQIPNCHFWRARSKNRVLWMIPALNTTSEVGQPLQPRLWPNPKTHPYPHSIWGTSSPLFREWARERVTCFHSPLLLQGPQWSLAWISCLASSQFPMIGEGWEPWSLSNSLSSSIEWKHGFSFLPSWIGWLKYLLFAQLPFCPFTCSHYLKPSVY